VPVGSRFDERSIRLKFARAHGWRHSSRSREGRLSEREKAKGAENLERRESATRSESWVRQAQLNEQVAAQIQMFG